MVPAGSGSSKVLVKGSSSGREVILCQPCLKFRVRLSVCFAISAEGFHGFHLFV